MRNPEGPRRTDTASLIVAAPPDEVYAAFAQPDALITWLPPDDMTGRVLEYDFREGGRYGIELTYGQDAPAGGGKTTGRTDVTRGRFLTLIHDARIVQSVDFDSPDPALAGQMTMTWSFDRVATGTRVTVTAEDVPPGIGEADHHAGLRSSLENLARHLG